MPKRSVTCAMSPDARTVVSVGALVASLLVAPGCPQQECVNYNDCPSGEYCDPDHTCKSSGTTVGDGDDTGNGGPGGDGDGDGNNGTLVKQVQTSFPVTWMKKDPRPGENAIFVPQYEVVSGRDDLVQFNLASETMGSIVYDLLAMDAGPCEIDNVFYEDDLAPNPADDEQWFVCRRGQRLRIIYDENVAQPGNNEPGNLDLGFGYTPTGADLGLDMARRIWFSRGGADLASIQIQPTQDALQNPRTRDTIEPTFSAITQVDLIASTPQGDTLLVFDRANPPTITPLLRRRNTDNWVASDLGLPKVELPSGTMAIFYVGTVDAEGDVDPNDANLMTIEPAIGRLGFYAWAQGGLVEIGETIYEQDLTFQVTPPAPTERLLLEPSPDGTMVFFMMQNTERLWRLPLVPFADNDVFRFTFGADTFLPSGMVPISSTEAWISVPSESSLYRVKVAQNN